MRAAVGLPPIPPAVRGQYTTLPGLQMLRLERVPRVGDRVRLSEGDGWEAEVATMHGRRVCQVLFRRRGEEVAR